MKSLLQNLILQQALFDAEKFIHGIKWLTNVFNSSYPLAEISNADKLSTRQDSYLG